MGRRDLIKNALLGAGGLFLASHLPGMDSPSYAQANKLIINDNFSDPLKNTFPTIEDSQKRIGYVEGRYLVKAKQGSTGMAIAVNNLEFRNIEAEAKVRLEIGGSPFLGIKYSNEQGSERFIRYSVSPVNGRCFIDVVEMQGDSRTTRNLAKRDNPPSLNWGNELNTLRLEAQGHDVTGYLNGVDIIGTKALSLNGAGNFLIGVIGFPSNDAVAWYYNVQVSK